MTDEEMMRSGIGAVQLPAPTEAPSATPMPSQGTAATESAAQTAAMPRGYRIQLLSTKSATDTQEGWERLLATYPDLLTGLQFQVVEVDLGPAKGGVWYRGLAGPISDRDEANMLCAVIKSRPPHNECFVAGP
jgi:hypothetical protein